MAERVGCLHSTRFCSILRRILSGRFNQQQEDATWIIDRLELSLRLLQLFYAGALDYLVYAWGSLWQRLASCPAPTLIYSAVTILRLR